MLGISCWVHPQCKFNDWTCTWTLTLRSLFKCPMLACLCNNLDYKPQWINHLNIVRVVPSLRGHSCAYLTMKEGTYPAVSYPSSCAFKLVIHDTLCQDDAGYVITVASVYIQHSKCPMTLLNLSKYNSASEMFVNLNFPSFDELWRKCVLVLGVVFETLVTC